MQCASFKIWHYYLIHTHMHACMYVLFSYQTSKNQLGVYNVCHASSIMYHCPCMAQIANTIFMRHVALYKWQQCAMSNGVHHFIPLISMIETTLFLVVLLITLSHWLSYIHLISSCCCTNNFLLICFFSTCIITPYIHTILLHIAFTSWSLTGHSIL